ncbi:MAG TPA: ATP-binding cassette domain-containing protein [Acholeplasmataceae bacterium]|nr:ATP-binding cassette domain-containing protein [Acholeplasmataceae bacterium]
MTEIKVNEVTKDYGKGRGVFDLDFEIKTGEIFGFVGTNGSGKTTTIRQMMGFLKPTKGNIEIRGLDAYKDATETKNFVGYIPGEIAFPDLPTGRSFIRSQAEFWKLKDLSFADELVKILQIDLSANPRKMSKGMKQKTAVIAALMNDSEILLLDEPTTGLDPLMRKHFLDILKREKAKGKTIFISSNIFQELEALCDRVALIKDGRIIDIAVMEEIRNPKRREYKIEFLDAEDFTAFKNLPYDFVRIKDEQKQVVLKIDIQDTGMLIRDLANYKIKFISENKYSLEKYFKEKFERIEGNEDDQ